MDHYRASFLSQHISCFLISSDASYQGFQSGMKVTSFQTYFVLIQNSYLPSHRLCCDKNKCSWKHACARF